MQNANDNKPSDNAAGSTSVPQNASVDQVKSSAATQMNQVEDTAKTQMSNVKEAAQNQVNNVEQKAEAQMQNAAKGASDQIQNLGQAGVNQVQNISQAGIDKMSQMMGQITNPTSDMRQPPVSKDEKVYATIAYIPFVAIISIIIKPDSAYVRLHAKQGLLLAALFFFGGIFAAIVSLFGIVGQLLAFLLGLIPMASLIIAVYSMYLAASGFWWKIPVLGAVADIIPVEMMAKASKDNITGQMGTAKVDYDNRQDTLQKEVAQNKPTEPVAVTPIANPANTTSTTAQPTATPSTSVPTEGQQTK